MTRHALRQRPGDFLGFSVYFYSFLHFSRFSMCFLLFGVAQGFFLSLAYFVGTFGVVQGFTLSLSHNIPSLTACRPPNVLALSNEHIDSLEKLKI